MPCGSFALLVGAAVTIGAIQGAVRGRDLDWQGGDAESDHDRRCRRRLGEGGPRLAPPVRGAGVDARRQRPDRQRRRQALAAADLGGHARADHDRLGGLDRHQSRGLARRQVAGLHGRGDLEDPSRWAASRRGSRPQRGITSTPGRPTASGLPFQSDRGQGLDLFSIAPDGGSERRLTTDRTPTTPPSIRPTAAGSTSSPTAPALATSGGCRRLGPGDAKAEPITGDDREDAAPHPSPDGKWLVYLSYPPRTNSTRSTATS